MNQTSSPLPSNVLEQCPRARPAGIETIHRVHGRLLIPSFAPAGSRAQSTARDCRLPQQIDVTDPRPWLDAYAAGVGSPLEHAFLRLFEQHGLVVEKQVAIGPDADGPPISTADFVVPETRVAIYIDGAAFHRGDRLRRDRFIRERLRSGSAPWHVVELRAADLGRGRAVVDEIRRARAM
jgi:hypothetical protein